MHGGKGNIKRNVKGLMKNSGMEFSKEHLSVFLCHDHPGTFFKKRGDVFVFFYFTHRLPYIEFVLFCDIYRDHIIFFLVKGVIRLEAGNDRDLMFYALSAEKQTDTYLHFNSPIRQ